MEQIKNIEIKNFKSIRHQKIEGCKRINVFIGYPNVGKSNILEALSLFSIDKEDINFKELVRTERNTTIFFDGDISQEANIRINGNVRIICKYSKGVVSFTREADLKDSGFDKSSLASALNDTRPFKQLSFDLWESEKKIKSFSGALSDLNNPLSSVFKYEFRKDVQYLSQQDWQLISPFGQNIFGVISADKTLKRQVAELFKNYNVELLFETSEQKYTLLKRTELGIFSIPYSLIADTLQRIIFYKAAILSNKDAVLLFEEPESHMFPPYIKKFTSDIIFDETNQFFIATHSPYVITELIEEVQDDLAMYVVDYDKGETIVKRLTDEEVSEVAQYGIDLFFNLESYLERYEQPHSA